MEVTALRDQERGELLKLKVMTSVLGLQHKEYIHTELLKLEVMHSRCFRL